MHHHAVVIGAGPAGLATSQVLGRHGIDHVVLERGNTLGHTWANLYDSLVLHTGKHLSSLPGLPFSRTGTRSRVENFTSDSCFINLGLRVGRQVIDTNENLPNS